MLLDTGCRREEIAALTLDDVNLEEGQIAVKGKGGRNRNAFLGQGSVAALDRYLRRGRRHHVGQSARSLAEPGRELYEVRHLSDDPGACRGGWDRRRCSPTYSGTLSPTT